MEDSIRNTTQEKIDLCIAELQSNLDHFCRVTGIINKKNERAVYLDNKIKTLRYELDHGELVPFRQMQFNHVIADEFQNSEEEEDPLGIFEVSTRKAGKTVKMIKILKESMEGPYSCSETKNGITISGGFETCFWAGKKISAKYLEYVLNSPDI